MSAASPVGKAPIFIMSFNRPDYLGRVLESLRGQRDCDLERRPIVLFQDGAVNPFSGRRRAADEEVEGCVRLFRQAFPQGLVQQAPHNLGVAMNFDRAERFGFEEMQAPSVIFLEDDLVLEKDYIAILDGLCAQFADDPRVGYLAAYGDHRKTLEEQQTNSHKLQLLYHNWGFALYRRQWLRMRPKVIQYLDIVRDSDYAMRDHARIRRLFAAWGYGCPASSQDAAKTMACCADNVVKLNTWTCHATYIGVRGVHMTEAIFAERRYADTEIYPERPAYLDPLDEDAYAAILKEQRDWAARPRPEDLRPVAAPLPAPVAGPVPPQVTPPPASLTEGLARALYRVVLLREPDAAGLAFHAEQMQSEAGVENSVRGFFRSAEFRKKLGQFLKTYVNQGEVGVPPGPADAAGTPAPASRAVTPSDRVCLVAVGGSGGVQPKWQPHLDRLQLVLFEPDKAEAARLRDEYASAVVIDAGLAHVDAERELFITRNHNCISLRPPTDEFLKFYPTKQAFELVRRDRVQCRRYDSLHAEGAVPVPDVIRIDVQGCEYEVLLGFGALLQNALAIEAKCHLYPLYEGQKLLHDIVALLADFGFVLRTLTPSPNFEGDLVEADAVFTRRRDLMPKPGDAQAWRAPMIEQALQLPPR